MAPPLHRRALLLSYFTVFYNILEGSLVHPGRIHGRQHRLDRLRLDSFVESLSGRIVIWRFRLHGKISAEEEEKAEEKPRGSSATPFSSSPFISSTSRSKNSIFGKSPNPASSGSSSRCLPDHDAVLFFLKYRTGREMGSRSLIADSKETLACSFLSLALLVGLGLNYFFGLWQADPIIGFVIVGYLIKEGRETLAGGEDEE